MKSFTISILVILLIIFLISCESTAAGGSGDDPTTRVVEGTITVPNSSYWTFLKLGVFSGGTAGDYNGLEPDNYDQDVYGYRVIYEDPVLENANDGSDMPVTPMAAATYTIDDTSGTSSSYSMELPSALPVENEEYIFAAWYDGNSNGNLDLKDMDPLSFADLALVVAEGEFNRLPTKDTLDNDDNPTTIVIMKFYESVDLDGNPSGNYKYYGYDDSSFNAYIDLTISSQSGFNFNITANSGW